MNMRNAVNRLIVPIARNAERAMKINDTRTRTRVQRIPANNTHTHACETVRSPQSHDAVDGGARLLGLKNGA